MTSRPNDRMVEHTLDDLLPLTDAQKRTSNALRPCPMRTSTIATFPSRLSAENGRIEDVRITPVRPAVLSDQDGFHLDSVRGIGAPDDDIVKSGIIEPCYDVGAVTLPDPVFPGAWRHRPAGED